MWKQPGRSWTWTRRQLIDGTRRHARAGTPWRDVPDRYGPWERITTCSAAGGATAHGSGSWNSRRSKPMRRG
ncbi:hypothetical protein [Streptomyces sp. AA1529]|uniref:hypothetical protein n=1 Tax=Streptomyces sp. AA1529 TaxID=1203257 RepID=UPI003D74B796